MPRIIILLVAIVFSGVLSAQKNNEEKDTETSSVQVKKVIEIFF